jgi:hypothetical protein
VLNPNSNNLPTARRELVLSACQEISVVRSSLSLSARVHNEAPKIVAKKKTSGGVGTRISGDSSQTIELFRVPLLFVLSPDYQQESWYVHKTRICFATAARCARVNLALVSVIAARLCFFFHSQLQRLCVLSSSRSGADNHFPQYAHYS